MPHTPTLPTGHIATLEDVKADCYWKMTQLSEMLDEQLRTLDDDLTQEPTQPAKRFVGVNRLTSLYGRMASTLATLEKKMAPRPAKARTTEAETTPAPEPQPPAVAEAPATDEAPAPMPARATEAETEQAPQPPAPAHAPNPDQLPPPISTYQKPLGAPEPFYPIHYPTDLRLAHPQPEVYRHYMDHKPPHSLLLY